MGLGVQGVGRKSGAGHGDRRQAVFYCRSVGDRVDAESESGDYGDGVPS